MQRRCLRLAVPVAQEPVDEHVFKNETAGKRTGTEETEIRKKVKLLSQEILKKKKFNLCRQEEESDVTFR